MILVPICTKGHDDGRSRSFRSHQPQKYWKKNKVPKVQMCTCDAQIGMSSSAGLETENVFFFLFWFLLLFYFILVWKTCLFFRYQLRLVKWIIGFLWCSTTFKIFSRVNMVIHNLVNVFRDKKTSRNHKRSISRVLIKNRTLKFW